MSKGFGSRSSKKKKKRTRRRRTNAAHNRRPADLFGPYLPPRIDVDALLHPERKGLGQIPDQINIGTVLSSKRHGIKCLLLDPLEGVELSFLKKLCLRTLNNPSIVYLPIGTVVYKESVTHQGRDFVAQLEKGTVFLSPSGHPNGYLLDKMSLPLRKELGSDGEYIPFTEASAKRHL